MGSNAYHRKDARRTADTKITDLVYINFHLGNVDFLQKVWYTTHMYNCNYAQM